MAFLSSGFQLLASFLCCFQHCSRKKTNHLWKISNPGVNRNKCYFMDKWYHLDLFLIWKSCVMCWMKGDNKNMPARPCQNYTMPVKKKLSTKKPNLMMTLHTELLFYLFYPSLLYRSPTPSPYQYYILQKVVSLPN